MYVLAAIGLGASSSPAEEPQATADRLFRRGVVEFQAGDFDGALQDFEAAYRVSPHYSVLYNLGLTYNAIGRSVEAVDMFARYLHDGGADIDERRREQLRGAIAAAEKRIGSVEIAVQPNDAEVFVDGRRLEPAAAEKPLRLTSGLHALVARAPRRATEMRNVEIHAGDKQRFEIDLAPSTAAAAVLRTSCSIPDYSAALDGAPIALGNDGIVWIQEGRHQLTFARDGYDPDMHEIEAAAGAVESLACRLKVRADLRSEESGRLDVRSARINFATSVDDTVYRGELLPIGRHHVAVRCTGCLPWEGDVVLQGGETRAVLATPSLTPEAQDALGRDERRRWAYVAGGAGLAAGAAAAALLIIGDQRSSTWQREANSLGQQLANAGTPTPALVQASLEHQHDAAGIRRLEDFGVATAILGAALLGTSAYLYFSSTPSSSGVAIQKAPMSGIVW